jgi:3-oxoadipate enol-lactonase
VLVAVPGGELYVEERGSGFPLLLIQGLGYAVWAWRRQVPELSRRRRTIAFDNRGAGRSFKPPGPYTIEQLADDAAALLYALGVERADVLGLSMGGYISQMLALRRPDLVRSLVLAGTGPGEPTHTPIPEETESQWLAHAHLPPEQYARQTMHLSFAPGWADEHADVYEELLAARLEYPTPPDCWRAQYDACMRFVQTGIPVERIEVPARIIHGDADRVVPVKNGRALAQRLPRAELVVLPGAGHLALMEDPKRFNRLVVEFLERVDQEEESWPIRR